MRRAVVVAVCALAMAGCGGSDPDQAPSDASSSVSATVSPSASASSAATAPVLAGTWRFAVKSPRLTFGTDHYKGATVRLVGNQMTLTGTQSYSSQFGGGLELPPGDAVIKCQPDLCFIDHSFYAFQAEGSNIRMVDRASYKPFEAIVQPDARTCGAPPVADAYVIKDASASSFSFVQAQTSVTNGSCYQVVWTVVATRVA
jgi:hypothetical protein